MSMQRIRLVFAGLAAAFAAAAAPVRAQIETPTMGWSSWNTYRVHISDSLICRQADAMLATGLGDAGYEYINIDDGYFGGRDAGGRLRTHPTRFPRGLRPVVEHIHGLGFKAGIYSDAGRNTCGHFWDDDRSGSGVGFYGHDDRDARFFFGDLGFDFIKIDFCGGDAAQNTDSLQLDERSRYTAIRQAIDRVGRPDVRINVCRWAFPGTWVREAGTSWRISGDINVSRETIRQIIERNLYLSAYAGEGHYNDMDMLEVGRGLGDTVDLTHFGMWCMMASPLLIGCDLTTLGRPTLRLLTNRELIALDQDPLGLQARVAARCGEAYVLVKDLERTMGCKRALAVYNSGDEPVTVTVDAERDLNLAGRVRLRNAGLQCDAGEMEGGKLRVTLPPFGSAFYVAVGERRTEQRVYEAEEAWLDRYSAIEVRDEQDEVPIARVVSCDIASGGKTVARLGGPGNWMEWRRVHSLEGGRYRLTLRYRASEERRAELSVNGRPVELGSLAGDASGRMAEAVVRIYLNKGCNVIRLGNESGPAPDIDCLLLERIE